MGCREVALSEDLERFVHYPPEGILHDIRRKAPGRGAWVHASEDCLEAALERGGFARAFRASIPTRKPGAFFVTVKRGVETRLREAIVIARRAHALSLGSAGTVERFKRQEVDLVLIAADAGASTRRKFAMMAHAGDVPVCEGLNGAELGSLGGYETLSVACVYGEAHSDRIRREVDKLGKLGGLEVGEGRAEVERLTEAK